MLYHTLDAGDIAELASGFGGPAVLRELALSRMSRHLLLLLHLTRNWSGRRDQLDEAVTVLAHVQRCDPTTSSDLIGDPMVGAWLTQAVRRLGQPGQHAELGDLLHLGGLAAAGAARLKFDCRLSGYARAGRVMLPTLGEVVVHDGLDGPVTITVENGTVSAGSTSSWRESRRLVASSGTLSWNPRIEDCDPYRGGYHAPPDARLRPEAVDRWQELFAEANELISRHLPERAHELTTGVRALVPLVDQGDGAARSCTSPTSVGALGLTLPRSGEAFVLTLVHELQHSKLSAVLDIMPLHSGKGAERHFAPWRVDARPIPGLIHGVYAFLGVADTLNRLRPEPRLTESVTDEFAEIRIQVDVALTALERSTELTPDGVHFTRGMRAALDRLLAEPLPEASVRRAESRLNQLRSSWSGRHPALADQLSISRR